jgi:hypothetical protein
VPPLPGHVVASVPSPTQKKQALVVCDSVIPVQVHLVALPLLYLDGDVYEHHKANFTAIGGVP